MKRYNGSASQWEPGFLTDILCTQCGLCCDGTLFADVELAGAAEAAALEAMGLEVEHPDAGEGALLIQPCAALRGTRCSIYPHRPGCCRTFECRLLQEVKRGKVSVASAQEKITAVLNERRRTGEEAKAAVARMVGETFL